jgi:hypothetical protein
VKVARATMNEYRKWAKETGCMISFLVNRALKNELARREEGASK